MYDAIPACGGRMMNSGSELWLITVSVIPGTAMLVLSSSARYIAVALQLREQSKIETPDRVLVDLIYRRARSLQRALLALYGALIFFISSALASTFLGADNAALVSKWGLVLGGITVAVAIVHLYVEIFASRKILARDYAQLSRQPV